MPQQSTFFRRHIDVVLFILVVLVAALIRARSLHAMPMLTDETENMVLALQIARGDVRPLVSLDAYNGSLFEALLALGMWAGLEPSTWPRWCMWAMGSLTVGLTYVLGISVSAGSRRADSADVDGERRARRAFGDRDRLVGLVAAAIMSTAFVPVVLHSRLAWSNASSPFWTTAFLAVVAEAHRRDDPRWLLPAGLLAGLAQQTHPSVLPALLGGALFLAFAHGNWLRGRWPWFGLALAVATTGNLIAYNIQTRGDTYRAARAKYYAYAFGVPWDQYVVNLRNCLRMAYQLSTSAFMGTDPEQGTAALDHLLHTPWTIAYGVIVVLALVMSVRRGKLPILVTGLSLVIISLFNRAYRYYLHARYLSAGLAVVHVALGLLVVDLLPGGGAHPLRTKRRWVAIALAGFLILAPVPRLAQFFAGEASQARTNARLWQSLDILSRYADTEHPARLDRRLHDIPTLGGGQLLMVLDDLLSLRGIPHKKPKPEDMMDSDVDSILVLTPDTAADMEGRSELVPLEPGSTLSPFGRGTFDLYRLRAIRP